ncbi:MAG: gamma-glutamyl-gamma-aminobutyrate hydrolase family protein [Acidobacteria bacterium]|nr:gamma-glutamyl-gamma-aminobutyrate hydrolase family protein [Acidobacteriota bacterium]
MSAKHAKPLIGLTCRWDENNDYFYLPVDYARAVAAAGGMPVQIPLLPEIASEIAERLDGFVLCGSPSDVDPALYGQPRHPEVKMIHPERDETDSRVLEQVFREKKPALGICFGMQSLNVYLQGTLIQHIPDSIGEALEHKNRQVRHPVILGTNCSLVEWSGGVRELSVNSTHHQAIEKPGKGLHVVAKAPDGVVEAMEGEFPGHFVIGVQWHPERIWREEPLSARLFTELVAAASGRREKTRTGAKKPGDEESLAVGA